MKIFMTVFWFFHFVIYYCSRSVEDRDSRNAKTCLLSLIAIRKWRSNASYKRSIKEKSTKGFQSWGKSQLKFCLKVWKCVIKHKTEFKKQVSTKRKRLNRQKL